MRYGKSRRNRNGQSDGSFWLCFSDLMSALMLVFVLVLFYTLLMQLCTFGYTLYVEIVFRM